MADIQYINYGDQQIEQQALLNNLSDNVYKYVQRQPWSNKKKEKFMSAYQDIISRGVLGASNSTGEWRINVGGDVMPTMDKKDREMYEEAAYFIQQQMASLPTKASEEQTKEEEKSELPIFDNDAFITDFRKYISSTRGGQSFVIDDKWNNLDSKRNEKGERERTERTKKLLEYLEGYKNKFDSSKYSFKDSPFENDVDFKLRLDKAIQALKSPELNDDNDALMNLGLNPDDWFNNGTGDPYTADKDFTGTYGQYYNEYLPQKQKEKKEVEAKQQEQISQFGIRSSRPLTNLVTRRALADKYGNLNTLTAQLGDYGDKLDQLSSEELDEVISALSYGATQPISDDEWNILKANAVYANSNRNRFRKHLGVDNLIYDTATKRAIQIYDKSQGTDYLVGQSSVDEKNQALQHKWGEGLTDDMIADLTALGLDAVSAGSAFVPGYGTAVSAVTGIGATIAGAVADRERGESWGSTLGTAGFGLTMDILGLIPGLGVAGKAAKMAKTVAKGAKWIGPALGGLAAMSYGPGAMSAFNKFTSGKTDDITAEELRDFTYALRAIAVGGVRKAGSTYQGNRTLKKALVGKETVGTTAKGPRASISTQNTPSSITTKNGQKIKLTDDEFKTLNSNASRENKSKIINQALSRPENSHIKIEEDEIEWQGINPIKGRFKPASKSSKVSGLQEGTNSNRVRWTSTDSDYKGIRRFSNENLLRNYMQMGNFGGNGMWRWMRDRWNGNDIIPKSTNVTNPSSTQNKPLLSLPNKNQPIPNSPLQSNINQPSSQEGRFLDIRHGVVTNDRQVINNPYKKGIKHTQEVQNKKQAKNVNNGKFSENFPESNSITFKTPNGVESITVTSNGNTYSITKKSVDGSQSSKAKIELENVKNEILKTFKESFTKNGKQLNIPPNIVKILQGTAYGWLKQGGRIDKQKIQIYKKYIGE